MGQKADGLKGINGLVINQIGKIKWIRINISADNTGKICTMGKQVGQNCERAKNKMGQPHRINVGPIMPCHFLLNNN
jgi:hypothetical protein